MVRMVTRGVLVLDVMGAGADYCAGGSKEF
jgi:hypothetical protein